jgi:CARDB/Thrombospondin type 3 repeat
LRYSRFASLLVLAGITIVFASLAASFPHDAQAASPDLRISAFSLDPPEPIENQVVTVSITVVNSGDGGTGDFGEFWVDFYADRASAPGQNLLGDDFCDMDPMAAASTAVCEVSHIYDSPGPHNMWIQADTDADISESNESNNVVGPIAVSVLSDSDFDTVADISDNCMDEANPDQANVVHPATPAGDACEDPDADEIFDSIDNCPDVANPTQANDVHPAVPAGDLCEDPDGDGVPDVPDNCPDWPNLSQALPTWSAGVPLTGTGPDSDCDRFSDSREAYLGTDPARQCAATGGVTPPPGGGLGANDEPPPDAWPADMTDNQIANTADVGRFVFSLNSRANQNPADPGWDQRHDLDGSGVVNTADVGRYVFVLNRSCTPSGP